MHSRKASKHKVSLKEIVGDRPHYNIHAINQLDTDIKERAYSLLVPDKVFQLFDIDRNTFLNRDGDRVFTFKTPQKAAFAIIEVREYPDDLDCIFYLEIEDTPFFKVSISFLIINDLRSPRFNTDKDEQGRRTKFGTARRNVLEEIRAMQAGLAPGQVRKGLRLLRHFFPLSLQFFSSMGQDMITAEPLAYHDAIIFENYGFDYIRGKKLMQDINREFQPGGELFEKLDGSTPFRQPGMHKSVRGRSWALHDGILGEPWKGPEMYRSLEHAANVCTFPGQAY